MSSRGCITLFTKSSRFWGIFWVDVSDYSRAEAGFLSIAGQLQIPLQKWEDVLQELVNLKKSWLLVLDNADDPNVDYQRYFPTGSSGVVILTTRNDQCRIYAVGGLINLEGLSDIDAQSLLFNVAQVPESQYQRMKNDAQVISKLLGSHPLALIQAGAYVACGHSTLNDYPEVYRRQQERLLKFGPSQIQPRYQNVYATFEASADALKSDVESASDVLQLLSVLASLSGEPLPLLSFEIAWTVAKEICSGKENNLNLGGITQWHVDQLVPLISIEKDEWDLFRLTNAVNRLKTLALVSTEKHDYDPHQGSISMHPLIHAWANERNNSQERHTTWISAGCFLAICSQDEPLWRAPGGRFLSCHIQALVSSKMSLIFDSKPPRKVFALLMQFGWFLEEMGDDIGLSSLLSRLFRHLGWEETIVSPEWLDAYLIKAINYTRRGESEKAIPLLEQMVELIKQTNLPAKLLLHYHLAAVYLKKGEAEKAVQLLEQMFKSFKVKHNADEFWCLVLKFVLIQAYKRSGEIEKALKLSKSFSESAIASFELQWVDPLVLLHHLEKIYGELVTAEDAESYSAQVDEYVETYWKGDSITLLEKLNRRSMVNWNRGRREAGLKGQYKCVELARDLLGDHHPLVEEQKLWGKNILTDIRKLGERE